MDKKREWEQKVDEMTTKIHKNYAELAPFIPDAPIINLENDEVNIKKLSAYYESLQSLVERYVTPHIEGHQSMGSEMKTMVSCCQKLDSLGFTTQFKVNHAGLQSLNTDKVFEPKDVKIVNFYRFEGATDPQDNSILYAIETNDGEKGTVSDAYGAYGDPAITSFVKQVEDCSKKVDKDKCL